jgi:hypothetical protein
MQGRVGEESGRFGTGRTGSAGVEFDADVGAELSLVRGLGGRSIVASLKIAVLGVVLLVVGLRRPARNGTLT